MAECVLDANVLVAWIDSADSLHARASDLIDRFESEGTVFGLVDIAIGEAVSVLCRRLRERRRPAEIPGLLRVLRERIDSSTIRWVSTEVERLYDAVLDPMPIA